MTQNTCLYRIHLPFPLPTSIFLLLIIPLHPFLPLCPISPHPSPLASSVSSPLLSLISFCFLLYHNTLSWILPILTFLLKLLFDLITLLLTPTLTHLHTHSALTSLYPFEYRTILNGNNTFDVQHN